MRSRIWRKLFITFGTTTIAVVLIVLLLTRWTFDRGFIEYLHVRETERSSEMAGHLGDSDPIQSIYGFGYHLE